MHQCKSTGSKVNYVGSSSWKFEDWKIITVNIKKLLVCVCGVGGRERCSWLRQCTTSREVPFSIPGRVLDNFRVTYPFCPGAYSASNRNEYLGGKVGPEFRADNPTVLMVPYVVVTMEAQHSILSLSLH